MAYLLSSAKENQEIADVVSRAKFHTLRVFGDYEILIYRIAYKRHRAFLRITGGTIWLAASDTTIHPNDAEGEIYDLLQNPTIMSQFGHDENGYRATPAEHSVSKLDVTQNDVEVIRGWGAW